MSQNYQKKNVVNIIYFFNILFLFLLLTYTLFVPLITLISFVILSIDFTNNSFFNSYKFDGLHFISFNISFISFLNLSNILE